MTMARKLMLVAAMVATAIAGSTVQIVAPAMDEVIFLGPGGVDTLPVQVVATDAAIGNLPEHMTLKLSKSWSWSATKATDWVDKAALKLDENAGSTAQYTIPFHLENEPVPDGKYKVELVSRAGRKFFRGPKKFGSSDAFYILNTGADQTVPEQYRTIDNVDVWGSQLHVSIAKKLPWNAKWTYTIFSAKSRQPVISGKLSPADLKENESGELSADIDVQTQKLSADSGKFYAEFQIWRLSRFWRGHHNIYRTAPFTLDQLTEAPKDDATAIAGNDDGEQFEGEDSEVYTKGYSGNAVPVYDVDSDDEDKDEEANTYTAPLLLTYGDDVSPVLADVDEDGQGAPSNDEYVPVSSDDDNDTKVAAIASTMKLSDAECRIALTYYYSLGPRKQKGLALDNAVDAITTLDPAYNSRRARPANTRAKQMFVKNWPGWKQFKK